MVTNGIAVSSASGSRGEPRCALRVCDDLGREADGDVELTAELGESGLDLGVVGVGQAEPALRHRLRVRRDRVLRGWDTARARPKCGPPYLHRRVSRTVPAPPTGHPGTPCNRN